MQPHDGDLDAVARRVFDTLGAHAVGTRVVDPLPEPARMGSLFAEQIRHLCAVTRCSEIDDIDPLALVTPGAVVVPVALVLASESGADGPTLLKAITTGYQSMICLGEGLDGPHLLERGVWPTYLLAPAAAAAVAASLWDLDVERIAEARAIALARAAGVAGRPPGSPTSRWWLCGSAAVDGVLAAEAAAAGLRGDPGLLDRGLGPDGMIGFDPTRMRPGDPNRLELVETKPFATARQALPAVKAALAIRSRLGGRPIESIEVAVPDAYRAMVDRPAPSDRVSSLQSAQFQVAAALGGDAVLDDPVRASPRLSGVSASWMDATTVVADPDLSSRYPGVWSARVTVRLSGGGELREQVAEMAGTRRSPNWGELLGKYSRAGWDTAAATPLLDACRALPSAGPGCATEILSLVAAVN